MLSKAAFALLKWKGEGGVVGATSCHLKRDYSRWCSASTYTRDAAIPGVASDVSSCLYLSLSWLYQTKLNHTSGLVVGSASWAYRLQWSGSGVACGKGLSVVCMAARFRVGVLLLAGWGLRYPTPWVDGIYCPKRLLQEGWRLPLAACPGERRGAAAGTASLASVVQPPLPLYRDQSIDA